jgi:hypothetical protein
MSLIEGGSAMRFRKTLTAVMMVIALGFPSLAYAQQSTNLNPLSNPSTSIGVSDNSSMYRNGLVEAINVRFLPEDASPPNEAKPAGEAGGAGNSSDLASKFTNPTALLTSYGFQNLYNPAVVGSKGNTDSFQVRPVLPFEKTDLIPLPQILRVTIPVFSSVTLDNGDTLPGGFGDVQVFDLFVMPVSKTLTVGVGPVAIFPTATATATGQGRYQFGPAAVGLYTGIEKWQLGLLVQDLFSLGSSDRDSVHQAIYQIIATRHFEEGWYMGFCGQPATVDWLAGHAQFPVGVTLGRVFTIDKQPVNFNITPTYYVGSTELQPRFQIQFNFAFIYGK